jgi:hypothetical protein
MAHVTLQAADRKIYTAICEREGGWWIVTVPELEAGRVTQARTLDEVPAVVADLVATMTGADSGSIEVDVRAHAAGPDLVRIGGIAALIVAVAFAVARRMIRTA